LWQEIEQSEGTTPITQVAERKLRDDERVNRNLSSAEVLAQVLHSRAQVIDPDGRIREDQCGFTLRPFDLRRRTGLSSGIVPPKEANLRALSRSIRALRASRSSAVFSPTPVNSCARRTRSSSKATVVLMHQL